MYFTSVADAVEDYMTVNYLRDVAIQAGFDTAHINIEDVGWDPAAHVFTDLANDPIRRCFKLYPWEWMQREEFGPHVLGRPCLWLEPPWKTLLSNKAILPILWELFPQTGTCWRPVSSRSMAAITCKTDFGSRRREHPDL